MVRLKNTEVKVIKHVLMFSVASHVNSSWVGDGVMAYVAPKLSKVSQVQIPEIGEAGRDPRGSSIFFSFFFFF